MNAFKSWNTTAMAVVAGLGAFLTQVGYAELGDAFQSFALVLMGVLAKDGIDILRTDKSVGFLKTKTC